MHNQLRQSGFLLRNIKI